MEEGPAQKKNPSANIIQWVLAVNRTVTLEMPPGTKRTRPACVESFLSLTSAELRQASSRVSNTESRLNEFCFSYILIQESKVQTHHSHSGAFLATSADTIRFIKHLGLHWCLTSA